MTITSLNFMFFCLGAIVLFLIFPKKYRWISLLISSLIFYLYSAKKIIVFILITSVTMWLASRKMDAIRIAGEEELKAPGLDRAQKKEIKQKTAQKRKRVLQAALVFNIGILVVLKIFKLFTAAFTMLVGIFVGSANADLVTLVMPLGISYYTFATVGYLLDIYWKRYESESNYARFLLFAIYFPHILQGPISRYPKLGKELRKPELHFTWDNFVLGMESILLGCFKKMVIADRASIFVNNVIPDNGIKGSIYLLAILLDGIQIYADFSGYMDIVGGVSRMFDVELEQNFNHPFLAENVPEFWRRWHMSLGSWFKDYVYYPLSVSKTVKNIGKSTKSWTHPHLKNVAIVIIPVMITWLLTGLWHGTGYGYVLWGIYYGTLITISVTFSQDIANILARLHVNTECFSYRIFRTIKIFCIFCGGRFLGTVMTVHHRLHIIKTILTDFVDFSIYDYGLDHTNLMIILIGVGVLIAIAAIEQKENLFIWFNKQNRIFCAVVIYAMFFAVFILGIYGNTYDSTNFLYQQF